MEDITLDSVIAMLSDINDEVDFKTENKLVDDRILDSFDILAVISAIDDEFDVSVPAKDIDEMILRLADSE